MELVSFFLFLQEQIKDIIIICEQNCQVRREIHWTIDRHGVPQGSNQIKSGGYNQQHKLHYYFGKDGGELCSFANHFKVLCESFLPSLNRLLKPLNIMIHTRAPRDLEEQVQGLRGASICAHSRVRSRCKDCKRRKAELAEAGSQLWSDAQRMSESGDALFVSPLVLHTTTTSSSSLGLGCRVWI
jgi:hypothetical protein